MSKHTYPFNIEEEQWELIKNRAWELKMNVKQYLLYLVEQDTKPKAPAFPSRRRARE